MTTISNNLFDQDPANSILPDPSFPQPVPKPAPQEEEPEMRRFGDPIATRRAIYDRVFQAAQEMEPVVGQTHTLRLSNLNWADPEEYSKRKRKEAILSGQTLGRRLRGTWELVNNETGEVQDRTDKTVARIPYVTGSGTFVHRGNEYAIKNQQRLRAGVFTRVKDNGEVEAHANILRGGPSHRYFLDPAKGVFYMRLGQAKIPMMPLLKAMGATDAQLREAWGPEIHAANYGANDASALVKLKEKILKDRSAKQEELVSAFNQMELDPEVTQRTLGQPYENMGLDTLLDTSKKLLAVSRQEADVDDRDHLAYQTFLGPEDLLAERIRKDRGGVRRKLLWKLAREGNLSKLPAAVLQDQVDSALLESGLGQALEEINPAEVFDKQTQISRMGEGGIPSLQAVPDEARGVQPSHMGFMDPLRTPECYDEQTEVMTKQGWKPWPSVTESDEFACLVDGRLEFHLADKLVSYRYVGQMCGAKTALVDYLVTPDHRMYVRRGYDTPHWRIETANETHEAHVRILKCGGHSPYVGMAFDPGLPVFESRSNNSKAIDLATTDPCDWAEFVGWYLSEGNLAVSESRQSYKVMITQSPEANPENHTRIRDLLDRLPFDWSFCNHEKAFVVSRRHLYEWAKPLGKCDDKFIPARCFDWPEEARRSLLEGLLLGDGRKAVKGGRVGRPTQYCSTSRRLAYDVQRLLFTLGVSSRVVFEPDEREDHYLGCWVVHIHARTQRRVGRAHAAKESDFHLESYDGHVYCASVPGGLLYVRRNESCGIWCGNSFRVGVDVHLARNARKGRDGKLYAQFRDARSGKDVWRTPQDVADLAVAFPGSMKSEARRVPAMKNGRIRWVPKEKVDLVLSTFENAFSPLGNMVPLKSMVKGQRVAMASRMSVTGDAWVVVLRKSGDAYYGPIRDYVWRKGDKSPSIDKVTHRLVWKPVRAKLVHRNTKRLMRVTVDSGRSFVATEDHSCVTLGKSGRLEKIKTGDLSKGLPVPYAATLDCPETYQKTWNVPNGNKHNAHPGVAFPLTRDVGWFLGLYVAEGYGVGKDARAVALANISPEVQTRVCRFMADIGLCVKPSSGSDGVNDRVVINWLQLYRKLREDFGDGAYNKRLPAWVHFSPKAFREGLLSGYMAGDGIVSKPVARSTTTGGGSRSLDLVNGLTLLCASLGISTSVSSPWVNTGPGGSRVQQHKFTIRKEHQHLLPVIGHPEKDKKMQRSSWSGKRSYDWIPIFDDLRPMFNRRTQRRDNRRRRLDNRYMGRLDRRDVIDLFGDDAEWATRGWSSSSVWWDRVKRVDEVSSDHEFVYDLDMEDNVFLANGVFVHNTTQALPVANPEAPLVQSAVPGSGGAISFEDEYGSHMGAVRADQPGRVVAVTDDEITVQYADNSRANIELYNNHPYNRKSVTGDTEILIRRRAESGRSRQGLYIWRGPIREYQWRDDDYVLSVCPKTKQSAWKKVIAKTAHPNDKRLLRVKTASGRHVVVTEDHSLVTMGSDGTLVPIYPDDCQVGKTRLPVAKIPEMVSSKTYPGKSRNDGRVVGLYLAEGHCPPSQPNLVTISVEPDDRAETVLALLRTVSEGYEPFRNGGTVCMTAPKLVKRLVKQFGHRSHNKKIPSRFLRYPAEFREGLVEGYMGGDGCFWKDGNGGTNLEATSVSRELRDNLVDLLLSLDVFTTLKTSPRKKYKDAWRDGYRFRVLSGELHKLPRWFVYDDREERLNESIDSQYRASVYEMVPVPDKEARTLVYAGFDKTPLQGKVAKHRLAGSKSVFGKWGVSDVMWDEIVAIESADHEEEVYDLSVQDSEMFAVCHGLVVHNTYIHQTPTVRPGQSFKAGDLLARSNYTNDQGATALGVNARVAYVPWGGKNFEDAIVISDSMAKRLSSEHMYQHDLEISARTRTGKNTYLSLFPGKYDKKTLENMDADGVVKPGTVVQHGDPLILAAEERSRALNKVHKKRQPGFQDNSITWKHHDEGVVTDVVKTKNGPVVLVKGRQEMKVGDKMCYDPETSLLTRQGWKPVAEVTLDDELATLNPETEELEYHKPTHVHSFAHTGEMYYLNTKHLNMLVTPEHRLWVARPGQTYGEVTAKDFYESKGEWQFKKDCKWVGEERLLMEFEPYIARNSREQVLESVPMDIWLRFIGYYLSEGRTCRTSSGGYQVQISQFRTSSVWEDIHDTLVELGLRFSYRENENRFEINSKWLYGVLLPLGSDAYSKRVPEYVQELCSRQISVLFDSYMEGDGHKGACWEFGTSSEQLAFDLQVLCLKLGWCVKLKPVDREDNLQKNPHWRGRVNRSHLRPWWKKGQAKTYASNEEKMVQYDGEVYCVTVPNHIVYCKREDKTYWSLNSGRYG